MKKYGKYEQIPDGTGAKRSPAKSVLLQTYFTSLLSLVLCVTMFFGTSYAWFTSEVENTGNEIYIGILNVDLVDADGNTLNGNANPIFRKDVHWEPGYTALEPIKVVNDGGDLAFHYELTLKEDGNSALNGMNLNEVAKWFDVWCYHDDSNSIPTPANYDEITTGANWKKAGSLDEVLAGKVVFSGNMTKEAIEDDPEATHTYTVALHMNGENGPEKPIRKAGETDDDWNARNDEWEQQFKEWQNSINALMGKTIGLNVKLVATQASSEQDAFGNIYDAVFTDVSTADDLEAAFEEGGNIRLTNDIELDNILNVGEGEEVYLDMNGKTITAKDAAVDPVFYTYKNSKLTIDGNGTVILEKPSMSLLFPGGDVVIENGTFIRKVPERTPASQVGALIVGAKVDPWGSQTVTINGGYFDGGYYDTNAADIDEILAGTKTLTETADDIAKRGNSADANVVRVALKNNIITTLNLSYNLFKVYGGTFVGVNPAWGDEGCMLPTAPNYLRPWSYYQGALLDGQTFNENGIVLPDGYSIAKGATDTGRPTYTVEYTK